MAIRVEELRRIAQEVDNRDAQAKKAARLHAIGIRFDTVPPEDASLALRRMFPHLARQSPLTIALRVVYFMGYLGIALWGVCRSALHSIPHLAVQARDGLSTAWMRAAFHDPEKRP